MIRAIVVYYVARVRHEARRLGVEAAAVEARGLGLVGQGSNPRDAWETVSKELLEGRLPGPIPAQAGASEPIGASDDAEHGPSNGARKSNRRPPRATPMPGGGRSVS